MNLLTGFTTGLVFITLSELGDKSFFISTTLATRHPRRWVFVGVTAALFAMTVLSVLLGQVTAALPRRHVQSVVVALFLGFGLKLLYDASQMSARGSLVDEQVEALEAIEHREKGVTSWSVRIVLMEAFCLTFMAEWGDRTQLATITLAAASHPLGVVIGATLGHAICAAIAVVCGKLIAGKISERLLSILGGILFIVFGLVAAIEMT